MHLHSVLVDRRLSVDVPADDVHDLRPDEELRGGFRNLRPEPSLCLEPDKELRGALKRRIPELSV